MGFPLQSMHVDGPQDATRPVRRAFGRVVQSVRSGRRPKRSGPVVRPKCRSRDKEADGERDASQGETPLPNGDLCETPERRSLEAPSPRIAASSPIMKSGQSIEEETTAF